MEIELIGIIIGIILIDIIGILYIEGVMGMN